MAPAFPAPGGAQTSPNPTDRGKLGTKRHIVVDARGIPLAATVTGAHRHDSMAFESTLDASPAVPGLNDQPRNALANCMPTRATTLLAVGVT